VALVVKGTKLLIRVGDVFGKPVAGAEVAVFCNRTAIARAISDRDGLARFKNLADLRFYEVYVKPGAWG